MIAMLTRAKRDAASIRKLPAEKIARLKNSTDWTGYRLRAYE